MKKLASLLLAVALCACVATAFAGPQLNLSLYEDAFTFDAETFMAAYSELAEKSVNASITWSDPAEVADGYTAYVASCEGLMDVSVLTGPDGLVHAVDCAATLGGENTTDDGQSLGKSAALMVIASYGVEKGGFDQISQDELQSMQTDLTNIVLNLNSLDMTALAEGGMAYYGEVAGHHVSMFISLAESGAAVDVSFIFAPNEITQP